MVNSRVAYPTNSQNDMVFVARDDESQPIVDVEVDFTITTPSNGQVITTGTTNQNGEIRINIDTELSSSTSMKNQVNLSEVGTYKVETNARKPCNYNVSIPGIIEVTKNKFKPYIVQKKFNECNINIILLVKDETSRVVSDANVEILQNSMCNKYQTIGTAKSNIHGIACINGCMINCCFDSLKIKVSKEGFEDYYINIK